MKLGIGEILEKASAMSGDEQVNFLRSQWSVALGLMIQYALEPIYQWDLPAGTPPYKENPYLDQESNLYNEIRRMYIFFAPHPDLPRHGGAVPPAKKELNFIQMLENFAKQDAILLLHAKEKTLPYGFTAERMREVFPGLLSDAAVEAANPDLSVLEVREKPKKKPAARKPSAGTKKAPAKRPATKKPAAKRTKKSES